MVLRQLPISHHSVQQLVHGLLNDSSDRNRLACAIELMKVQEPEVKQAYIQALNDSFEKVVQVACFQLSYRGGIDTVEALYQVLTHRSWHVRLEVCKALIVLKAVDQRVVSTLEQMAHEPETSEYDAEYEELEYMLSGLELPDKFKKLWGKIGTILDQTRQLAAKREWTAKTS